ncbi:hypothetical protein Bca52824_029359 [Brassica carinata]|uniref:Large ribosomal subunit protein uL30 N-terminal eukaryotes domain-containing protein n=1 Tax=Brassica carinata TaxID=52824 RepID=A0A8X7VE81_BRACI|nr:hypothetical protein Bca52824_029359 [Brassica carinata]
MQEEMVESKVVVPESVLKKIKREEQWALAKKQEAEAAKKKNVETRKLIFKRAEQYSKEYAEKDNELIRLKREAKLKGGFCVDPVIAESKKMKKKVDSNVYGASSSSSSAATFSLTIKKSHLLLLSIPVTFAKEHMPKGRAKFVIHDPKESHGMWPTFQVMDQSCFPADGGFGKGLRFSCWRFVHFQTR